jgi:hypothetical protein
MISTQHDYISVKKANKRAQSYMADAAAMRANERLGFIQNPILTRAHYERTAATPASELSRPIFVFRAGRNQLLAERHDPVLDRHARRGRPRLRPFYRRSGPGRTRRKWRVSGNIAAVETQRCANDLCRVRHVVGIAARNGLRAILIAEG